MFGHLRRLFGREPVESAGAVRESMMFAGRARLITHLMDEWGEQSSSEFSFDPKPAGFDPLLVFEFAPFRDRNFWTYSTAGLSLCPAMDPHPPTELVAYSESQARGLVDLLHQVAFRDDPSVDYRPGDLISFDTEPPDLGVPLGRHYGLIRAPERAELARFPDLGVRPEDQRFVLARPGEDRTRLQFLRVVALADTESLRWKALAREIGATRAWRIF